MPYEEEVYQYQSPPRSPIPAAVITSIITSAAVFFGLRTLDERGVFGKAQHQTNAIEVPSLLGIRPEQARELLEGRGLLLTMAGEREDSKYPAGVIANQTPLPGSQAPRGAAVQAVVSRGVAQLQVPNLVGLRAEDALRQAMAAGLTMGAQKTAPSATVPAGSVVQTEPPAGAPVAPQVPVVLVVSAGMPGKPVPKVTGMRLSRARKALEEAGFVAGKVRYILDEDRMGGIVLKQEPGDGAQAATGAAIDLVVNED